MAQQLLWIEIVLKTSVGALLFLVPRATAKALGLPPVAQSFWPRLVGGALLGIAAAVALGTWLGRPGGLGLAGAVAINLTAAVVIVAELSLAKDGMAKRGRVLSWLAAGGLGLLGLVELAAI